MIVYRHKYRAPWQGQNIQLVWMEGEDRIRLLRELKALQGISTGFIQK